MKRFISILGFMLLFFAGKADTLTYYSISANGKYVTSTPVHGSLKIHLKSNAYTMKDTLCISRVGCFGDFDEGPYRLCFKDTLMKTNFASVELEGQPILLPMSYLLERKRMEGSTFFFVTYIPTSNMNARSITFQIYLE